MTRNALHSASRTDIEDRIVAAVATTIVTAGGALSMSLLVAIVFNAFGQVL